MAQEKEQNLKNHAKLVPIFHMFVLPVFLINIIWSLVRLRYGFTFGAIFSVLLAVALMVLALCARTFALKVQDRVIRLEMRLRMQQILPADLKPRIPEFTVAQLVLQEKLTDRQEIKRRVKNWRADYLRA